MNDAGLIQSVSYALIRISIAQFLAVVVWFQESKPAINENESELS